MIYEFSNHDTQFRAQIDHRFLFRRILSRQGFLEVMYSRGITDFLDEMCAREVPAMELPLLYLGK
jgi:hypothetical protein